MLDRLRACIIASYYGRVMHSAQAVSCASCTLSRLVFMSCQKCQLTAVSLTAGCVTSLW